MRRLISTTLTLCILLISGIASATWTGGDTITYIQQSRGTYDDGKTRISLSSVTCNASEPTFHLSPSTTAEEREVMMKILVSAMLSGRRVSLGYGTNTDGSCYVYSVKLLAN